MPVLFIPRNIAVFSRNATGYPLQKTHTCITISAAKVWIIIRIFRNFCRKVVKLSFELYLLKECVMRKMSPIAGAKFFVTLLIFSLWSGAAQALSLPPETITNDSQAGVAYSYFTLPNTAT